jgi:hypothetical protein
MKNKPEKYQTTEQPATNTVAIIDITLGERVQVTNSMIPAVTPKRPIMLFALQ